MKYLVLTFKNIKKFILFHPVMFIFLIFAQIVCCMAVFISCGMAYNMNYIETDKADSSMFKFSFGGLSKIGYLTDKDDSGKIIRSYPAAAKDAERSDHFIRRQRHHKQNVRV